MNFRFLIMCLLLLPVACTSTSTYVTDSAPSGDVDVSGIPDAVPRDEPHSKGGNQPSYKVFGKKYYVLNSAEGFREHGVASWYGNKFHGKRTSNGEVYDMYAMTAAHKQLPLPTYVRVTNQRNGRSVVVRVNDRGPFLKDRIIDLSYVAAKKLGMTKKGTAPVEIEAITFGNSEPVDSNDTQRETVAVQIGAFTLKQSAERVKNQLGRRYDLPVSISEVYSSGKKLFRVRLGPFNSVGLAKDWIETLNNTSFGPASLVYLN